MHRNSYSKLGLPASIAHEFNHQYNHHNGIHKERMAIEEDAVEYQNIIMNELNHNLPGAKFEHRLWTKPKSFNDSYSY